MAYSQKSLRLNLLKINIIRILGRSFCLCLNRLLRLILLLRLLLLHLPELVFYLYRCLTNRNYQLKYEFIQHIEQETVYDNLEHRGKGSN